MTRRSGLTRRSALLAPLLASPHLAAAWRQAAAQSYPAGTIRIIAPGPAGSPRDMRARWVADRVIRSSNGVEELRPVIRTTVALGGHRWVCEMTLAERGSMGHPVLLGRTAIRRRFLVHPGRSFLTDTGSIIAGAGGV